MTKAELRQEYLNRQRSFSSAEVGDWSQQITDQLFSTFSFRYIDTLHCFLPILKNQEINTWLIIEQLQRDFPTVQILIPRTDPQTLTMTSHVFSSATQLTQTRWGVPEPAEYNPISPRQIDCVLMPLLAYDQRGYRVGYGKGFYDRFLAECRPEVFKIGLSYHDPVAMIEDTNAFDVPLEYCVTPRKVWKFA